MADSFKVRKKNRMGMDPNAMYGGLAGYFCLKIFHGGKFHGIVGREYVGGDIDIIDNVEVNKLSINLIHRMIFYLGNGAYPKEQPLFCHFRVPGKNLEKGLEVLFCNEDVNKMCKYAESHKCISVFVEHGVSDGNPIYNRNRGKFLIRKKISFDKRADVDNLSSQTVSGQSGSRTSSVYGVDKAQKGKEKVRRSQECAIEELLFDELESTYTDPLLCGTSDTKGVKPKFHLCQEFATKKEIKDAILQHSIDTRRELTVVKNDGTRIRAICKEVIPAGSDEHDNDPDSITEVKVQKCPWTLHASKLRDETWQIKTLVSEHRCLPSRSIKACTSKYMAKELMDTVKKDPGVTTSTLKHDLESKYQVNVSRMKAYRAKVEAKNLVLKNLKEQYALLMDYCNEVMITHPGTTMKIEVEPCANPKMDTGVLKSIYCCLGPLKEGFKEGCRPVLAVDGAFIEGTFPGQLLSAIGIDANNDLYPLAWALVEAENKHSWEWFLSCLKDDLDLTSDLHFCFISDRQEGLVTALAKLFPMAEHRFCLNHIWENFKLSFKGPAYKDLLWSAASATNIPYFERAMEELKSLNFKAWEWLKQISPCHWSKSHFSPFPRYDNLCNNLCESFNSEITRARDKPIITFLEGVRVYTMNRIVTVQRNIAKCRGPLCPNIEKYFESIKQDALALKAFWNGGTEYMVNGPFCDQCVVDLEYKSCTCRKWDLTSIPCEHAIRAIWSNSENGGDSLLENWVDECYKVSTWKRIYSHNLNPIAGRAHQEGPARLLPPVHHVQLGRSKNARRKSQEVESQNQEGGSRRTKKSRIGDRIHCSKCGNEGHNSRTCKGQEGAITSARTQSRVPNGRESISLDANFGQVGSGNRQLPGASTSSSGLRYRMEGGGANSRAVFESHGATF